MQGNSEKIASNGFLITGGAGFIGSHIAEFLLKNNAKHVRVLDNLSTGSLENIKQLTSYPNFEFIKGDIRDLETCENSLKEIDFVSHQAALGSVPRSIIDPITSNSVNVSGFLNMLVACKKSESLNRMVYAASSSTYGDSKILPKKEDVIGKPLSPYAVTKLINEIYADVFSNTYGTDTIGLRYFNVFGPRQNPNGAYAAVIPLFISALIKNSPPDIHGDGEQTRDFTFIENVVQANINAFFAPKSASNHIFNIACGERISVNQLWHILKHEANSELTPNYVNSRKGDVRDSLADVSKAKALLDYVPNYKVKQGLKLTWEWFSNQKDFISANH